jgi:diadenosine tetraphosphate (Ap4A) HIT family hydrolase
MGAMRLLGCLAAFLIVPVASAEITGCKCDPDQPATLEARQCSLTREALAQPVHPPVFFLKDINPSKPNRMLAIPRAARKDLHTLAAMTPAEQLQLWAEAIRKARELWGDDWGLAVNGDEMRTQCQPHVHIGKFLRAAENSAFKVIDGPAQIPAPQNGEGLWIHLDAGKLHVHSGENLTETVLMR